MALRRRRRTRSSSLMLVGVGALAGLALGALIAERAGGVDGLLRGGSGKGGNRLPRSDGWRSEARDTDEFRPDSDADSELAPDAISHMHVRGARHDIETTAEFEVLEALEERVLEAFRNDPILAERAIDIGAISTGTIELTGWVRASSEIGHALTLARGVPGIEAVIDRLAVRGTESRHDHSTKNYANTPLNVGTMAPENRLQAD